jgi:uncharacterized membrane protein YuzA (DUF378 family)
MSNIIGEGSSKLMKTIVILSLIVAAIGAINWGTISLGYNLAASLFTNSKVRKVFYIIVGIAGIISLIYGIQKATSGENEYYSAYYGQNDDGNIYYADSTSFVSGGGGEYASLMDYYDAMD